MTDLNLHALEQHTKFTQQLLYKDVSKPFQKGVIQAWNDQTGTIENFRDLLARIHELEAENQKLRDGLDFTGEIIKHQCETLTKATHSQDLLWGDNGDGDYD